MLRSVRFYSFVSDWPDSENTLSAILGAGAFTPCTAFAEKSAGFEPPAPELSMLVRRVAGTDLLQLRTQSRLLPAAALNEVLEGRLAEYRERMQEEAPRRLRRQLKEQTRDELLPKALLKSQRLPALVIPGEQVLAIGTASQSRAEAFIDVLRAALGSFEVRPLEFTRPVDELLSQLFEGRAPRGFVVGRECRLRDPKNPESTVRWTNVDPGEAVVRDCRSRGMELTHLGFEFDNALGAVLDIDGVLTKLALPGLEQVARDESEDPLSRLDAEIALVGGTLRALLKAMRSALGGIEAHMDDAARDDAA
jgi:recombination associated protein RdgC